MPCKITLNPTAGRGSNSPFRRGVNAVRGFISSHQAPRPMRRTMSMNLPSNPPPSTMLLLMLLARFICNLRHPLQAKQNAIFVVMLLSLFIVELKTVPTWSMLKSRISNRPHHPINIRVLSRVLLRVLLRVSCRRPMILRRKMMNTSLPTV